MYRSIPFMWSKLMQFLLSSLFYYLSYLQLFDAIAIASIVPLGVVQISLKITGLRAWSLETWVAGRMVCCLSCLGMVSELFEGPM